jgi:hypothetical protein
MEIMQVFGEKKVSSPLSDEEKKVKTLGLIPTRWYSLSYSISS